MKIFIKKNLRLPLVLFLITTSLIFLTAIIKRKTSAENQFPNKEEVLSEEKYFLKKTAGDTTINHYVGEQTSSNYSIYVEKAGEIQYSIDKNPADFEFNSIDEYFQKYQSHNLELFGPWYDKVGFKSFVFLPEGLIVIAHPISRLVVETWHIDNNLDDSSFLNAFSDAFSQNPPESINIH